MKNFFAMILLCLAVAFAGCEPAGNNSGNAGNNNGTSGNSDGNTDGSNTNPDGNVGSEGEGNGTDTASGQWKVDEWQTWLDDGNGGGQIDGVTSLSGFCEWANEYFPDGIPRNPNGGNLRWSNYEWQTYMNNSPAVAEAFPGDFESFRQWASINFPYPFDEMPNTPPTATGGQLAAPAAPEAAETTDRSFEDAGLSEVQ